MSWAFPLACTCFCVLNVRDQLAALCFERDHLVLQSCRELQVAFFNGVEQIAQLATVSVFVYTSMKMTPLATASYVVYTSIKGNWATNEMLIMAGFCKQLLPLVVDTVRCQNRCAGRSRTLFSGVRIDLCCGGLLQHVCNVNEWIAVSTVAPVQQLSLVPGLPIPLSKFFML